MNYKNLVAVPLMSLSLAAWGQQTIITIDNSQDVVAQLVGAIDLGNKSSEGVIVEFSPGTYPLNGTGTGITLTPTIQSTFTFRPNTAGRVILDGSNASGRAFEIGDTANVTFDRVTLQNFNSDTDGGAIASSGNLTLTNSVITGNTAALNGGGIDLRSVSTTFFVNTEISNNLSNLGGGIHIQQSASAGFQDSVIAGNTARQDGGGIWSNAGSVVIVDTTVDTNTAGLGGGIFNSGTGLTLRSSTISGNSAANGGGLFHKPGTGGGQFIARDFFVVGNTASVNGGGIGVDLSSSGSAQTVTFGGLTLTGNYAATNGGGFSIFGDGTNDNVLLRGVVSENNGAGIFGDHGEINIQGSGSPIVFSNSIFIGRTAGAVGFENQDGQFQFNSVTIDTGGNDVIDSTGNIKIANTAIDNDVGSAALPKKVELPAHKATCNTFGIGMIQSGGNNITPDTSCGLNAASDRQNTDARIVRDPASGKFGLLSNSPAIDSALTALVTQTQALGPQLPCGYKDVNGLGRPQDGNLDGTFECDIGFIEAQGGPDIGPAQSAAYFDTGRNGEGVFVELIGNNLAFVAMFTYQPDGSGTAWFVGIGSVVGNSVVVDDMLEVTGGDFGAGFNAGAIERTTVGGLSLVFPTCEATSSPGRIAFEGMAFGKYSDLLVEATRLSSIVDCAGGAVSAQSGRSGSFFDVNRSGEGIFVQWLTNGSVVIIWYTFDTDGNPLWIINDVGRTTVNGNTVTATMLYPTASTSFGADFDAAQVVLGDWGTVTLQYQPGCDGIAFGFNSTVAGFGNGSYDYTRLTGLTGTSCDL